MMDQQITFNFAGQGAQLLSELRKIQQELKDLRKASGDAGQAQKASADATSNANQQAAESTRQSGFSVQELAAKYFLVVQALQAVLAAGKTVYGALIQQNVELQAQLLSTQSSLAATNKVIIDGVEVTDPTKAIEALEGPVNAAVERIRKGSLELVGVTSAQLVPIFQNIASQSGQIGASLNDSADLTLKFAAALGTLQIPLEQQRTEVNAILQANINSDAQLAKTLGITNEMVRQWKAQGTAVQELNKRLETFAAGNALAAQSIGGVASNIQEVLENITLAAGADLTDQVARDLNSLYSLLRDNTAQIQAFVQQGVDFFSALIEQVKVAGPEVLNNLAPITDLITDIFDEDLLNTLELIFQGLTAGFVELTRQVGENPALQALLKIIDAGIFATGAIASLGGSYKASTEAAETYRQQAERTSQTAVDALAATKRGEAGAAAARKEAIAQVKDQLKILKESNLTGAENRAVVRSQIQELEQWQTKLEGSASGVKLVSKDTSQLTGELQLLTKAFSDSAAEAELATTQLKAALQRQLEGGTITAREAQQQTLEIEREGLEARLQLIQERIDKIRALEGQGGDAEQQKKFAEERVKAETELAQAQISLSKNTIDQRKGLEQNALKELERAIAASNATIDAQQAERSIALQRAINAGTMSEREASKSRLEITGDRIRAELALEEAKLSDLEQLSFAEAEDQEANQNKIRDARLKTSKLMLSLLENERSIEKELIQEAQKAIADLAEAQKLQSESRQQQLTEQIKSQELINKALDRQSQLLSAQEALASAQRTALTTGGQIEIDNLSRALELRKRLNDASLDPALRKVIEAQLKVLTGKRDTSEAEIIAQRVARENALQKIKRESLAIEQAAARNNLEAETLRNRLAAERLVIETQIAKLAAEQSLVEAQARRDTLAADPNADPQQLASADAAVTRAQANVNLADKTSADAEANLQQQDKLAAASAATLSAQQQNAIAQFEAANAAREQANQLTIAEAKAEGILQRLDKASKNTFSDTFRQFVDRNTQLQGAQPILNAPVATLGAIGSTQPSTAGDRLTSDQQVARLEQLVALNQKMLTANETLNSQLLRLANRPQTVNNVENNLQSRSKLLTGTGL